MYCDDLPALGDDSIRQQTAPSTRLVAAQDVVVLVDVALLEILEAEVGPEESRRSILQRDPPIALDGRRPHPLVRGPVGMVDDQQGDALDLGGRGEAQDRFAVAVRADPIVGPPLVADLPLRVEHLEHALVALGLGVRAVLRFLDDVPGVVGGARNRRRTAEPRQHDSTDQQAAHGTSCSVFADRPYSTARRRWLFIFERLHERSVHRRLGRPDRRDERRAEHRRNERRRDGEREGIG